MDIQPSLQIMKVAERTMYENYTDAENTGVPLVPMVQQPEDIATDGGRTAELEEAVLSHRLEE